MFGDALREFRVRALLTQEELAALSGVSERQIREIESGRVTVPRASTVRVLAETLKLSPADRTAFQLAAQPDAGHPPTPAQLPGEVDGFTGRAAALRVLDAATAAVVTISGPAGVGKTSLAVHWSRLAAPRFPDGQLYVDLRGFSHHTTVDPAEVIRGFLDALGVPPDRIPSGFDAQAALYRSRSVGRRLLVVLDNARDADQVRPLLPGGPAARTVVTSRRQLTDLVAQTGAAALSLDVPEVDEAVELLSHRLGPGTDPASVAAIVAACGRLPLALALVGARARLTGFPPSAIAAELRHPGDRLAALEIDAVFSWSYDALSPASARLFRLLGLATSADIAVTAVAALAGRALSEVRRTLAELTHASLVTEHAPGRYRTHDLLHAYARERAMAEESEAARQAALTRLLDHYTHTAYHAELVLNPVRAPIPMTLTAPTDGAEPKRAFDLPAALDWLRTEQAVLLTALRQAEEEGMHRHAWQLSWALDTFLNDQRRWQDEGAAWAVALRAATALTDRPAAAHAHRFLSAVHGRLDRFDDAHAHMRQALDLSLAAGHRAGEAESRFVLSYVYWLQGDREQALDQAEQALSLFTELDDPLWAGKASLAVGWYLSEIGACQEALSYHERALDLQQRAGDLANEVVTWDTLGVLHQRLGDPESAIRHYESGLRRIGTMESPGLRAQLLGHLGDVSEAIGDWQTARERWLEAYEILRELGHPQAGDLRRKLQSPGPSS
ncbi:tetratricopeptide repeat protein [Nonomuraea sp. NEAU-A123]|uniref:ATP-binding protein n=1 Tax=Nonomuraea sp. NEAU-A123 TaxID=2839649 RepID=UPI001BE3F8C3|nr:tetratricopeptide repeat protein [Nonomuraea sp. NEAU-A123]MBT2233665.1 tetratricopeptide repeat protein [Nonomuraea sp. NEAU-A123]